MSNLDPQPDLPAILKTFIATMDLLIDTLTTQTEQIRKLIEASQDDTGASAIADELAALRTTVESIPAEILKGNETLANTAAMRAVSAIPC
jgi:hypothetical protein